MHAALNRNLLCCCRRDLLRTSPAGMASNPFPTLLLEHEPVDWFVARTPSAPSLADLSPPASATWTPAQSAVQTLESWPEQPPQVVARQPSAPAMETDDETEASADSAVPSAPVSPPVSSRAEEDCDNDDAFDTVLDSPSRRSFAKVPVFPSDHSLLLNLALPTGLCLASRLTSQGASSKRPLRPGTLAASCRGGQNSSHRGRGPPLAC